MRGTSTHTQLTVGTYTVIDAYTGICHGGAGAAQPANALWLLCQVAATDTSPAFKPAVARSYTAMAHIVVLQVCYGESACSVRELRMVPGTLLMTDMVSGFTTALPASSATCTLPDTLVPLVAMAIPRAYTG